MKLTLSEAGAGGEKLRDVTIMLCDWGAKLQILDISTVNECETCRLITIADHRFHRRMDDRSMLLLWLLILDLFFSLEIPLFQVIPLSIVVSFFLMGAIRPSDP